MSLQRIEGSKTCFCGKDPAPLVSGSRVAGSRYLTLCAEHRQMMLESDAKIAAKAREEEANMMRQLLRTRVEEAVPNAFDTMRIQEDPNLIRGMMNGRIHVADPVAFYAKLNNLAARTLFMNGVVVLFAGPTGVGKSHALALFLRLLAESVPVLPKNENPLTMQGGIFHGDWDSDATNPYVLWETAGGLFSKVAKRNLDTWPHENVPILALDDIGREGTQVNVTPVQDVLWARHDEGRMIVTTTGFVDPSADPEDLDAFLAPLSKRYDEAAVRRLAKIPGRCILIPMLPCT